MPLVSTRWISRHFVHFFSFSSPSVYRLDRSPAVRKNSKNPRGPFSFETLGVEIKKSRKKEVLEISRPLERPLRSDRDNTENHPPQPDFDLFQRPRHRPNPRRYTTSVFSSVRRHVHEGKNLANLAERSAWQVESAGSDRGPSVVHATLRSGRRKGPRPGNRLPVALAAPRLFRRGAVQTSSTG